MVRVLITGGLGYIGTVLTNLYIEDLEDEITVIDKKRDAIRENELLKNNVNFREIDILNKKELKKIVSNFDISNYKSFHKYKKKELTQSFIRGYGNDFFGNMQKKKGCANLYA